MGNIGGRFRPCHTQGRCMRDDGSGPISLVAMLGANNVPRHKQSGGGPAKLLELALPSYAMPAYLTFAAVMGVSGSRISLGNSSPITIFLTRL